MDNEYSAGPRAAAFRAALRRSLVLVVVLAVVGAAAGALLGKRASETYTASASILVEPLDGNPFSPTGSGDDLLNLQTEAELLRSDAVAGLVRDDLGSHASATQLLKGLSVSVPPNTQILTLDYAADNRDVAVARAQSFADVYLEYRRSRAQDLVKSQTGRIHDRVTMRNKQLEKLVQKLGTTKTTASADLLRQKIDSVSTQINQLQARAGELETGSLEPGQVVTPAAVPSTGLLGPPAMFGGAGLLGGLVLALAFVLVRSRADSRVHREEDVLVAGLPVLGAVGPGESASMVDAALGSDAAHAPLSEGFKRLRVAFLTSEQRRPVTVLLASASAHSVPPASAVGLGLSTALSNLETIILDATGASAGPTHHLVAEDQPGLNEVLTGDVSVDTALVPVAPHLQLLPAGQGQIDADDLFIAPEMSDLLDELRKRAEVVLVVGASVRLAQVEALRSLVDTVLLEATRGVTTQREIRDVADQNNADGGPGRVAGFVYVSGRQKPDWHPTNGA